MNGGIHVSLPTTDVRAEFFSGDSRNKEQGRTVPFGRHQLHAHSCARIAEEARERTARHSLLLLIGLETRTNVLRNKQQQPVVVSNVQ